MSYCYSLLAIVSLITAALASCNYDNCYCAIGHYQSSIASFCQTYLAASASSAPTALASCGSTVSVPHHTFPYLYSTMLPSSQASELTSLYSASPAPAAASPPQPPHVHLRPLQQHRPSTLQPVRPSAPFPPAPPPTTLAAPTSAPKPRSPSKSACPRTRPSSHSARLALRPLHPPLQVHLRRASGLQLQLHPRQPHSRLQRAPEGYCPRREERARRRMIRAVRGIVRRPRYRLMCVS